MVSCVPEIKSIKLEKEQELLVIATDGVWDCMSNINVLKNCKRLLEKH